MEIRESYLEEYFAQINQLKAELAEALTQLRNAQDTIRRAKDINPVQRPSFKRVMLLARAACLTLEKISGGWLLKLGHLIRRFYSLKQVWETLIADGFTISDLFPQPGEHWRKPKLRARGVSIAPSAEYLNKSNITFEEIPFT